MYALNIVTVIFSVDLAPSPPFKFAYVVSAFVYYFDAIHSNILKAIPRRYMAEILPIRRKTRSNKSNTHWTLSLKWDIVDFRYNTCQWSHLYVRGFKDRSVENQHYFVSEGCYFGKNSFGILHKRYLIYKLFHYTLKWRALCKSYPITKCKCHSWSVQNLSLLSTHFYISWFFC